MTLEQKIRVRVLDLILDASMVSVDWEKCLRGYGAYTEAAIDCIDHYAGVWNILRIKPNAPHWEHLV